MDHLIGKPPIHPVLFYTGKISGYFTWAILILALSGIITVERSTFLWSTYFSYVLLIIAIGISLLSIFNLGKSTRLGLPLENTELKTNGCYRVSRNPMYLGFNMLTTAAMLYTVDIWVILPGIYSIVVYHFIIISEEKFLARRFGSEYLAYRRKVRRYL